MYQKISKVLWALVRHDWKIEELLRTLARFKDGDGTLQKRLQRGQERTPSAHKWSSCLLMVCDWCSFPVGVQEGFPRFLANTIKLFSNKTFSLVDVAEPRLNLLQCSRRVDFCETCQMVQRAPVIRKEQSLRLLSRETPTFDIIKRHFCKLVMARERSKER